MTFGKNLGVTAVLFALLNFIFAIIYQAVGGTIGDYFSSGASNIVGDILMVRNLPIFGTMMVLTGIEGNVGPGVMEILWILVPGIAAAALGSWKFADESPRTAFWASTLGIFLIMMIGWILDMFAFGGTQPASTIGWVNNIVSPLLVSLFFAGFGAAASSSF